MQLRTGLVLMVCAVGLTQQPPAPESVPQDRAADSYAIYSQLLENGAVEGKDWKRSYWLVEQTTTAGEQPEKPCIPNEEKQPWMISVNPHKAIQPPAERKDEFEAVLGDFDQRCHERVTLSAEQMHTKLPVHMADDDMKKRYVSFVFGPAHDDETLKAEFKDTAGIHSFSEVYFNKDHSLAMVYQGIYCGGLCGNWRWVVLERKDGKWTMLPWVRVFTVS